MLRKFKSAIAKYWKALAFVVLLFSAIWAILLGYSFVWTGFGDFINPNGEFVRGKTFWDWMELFIIPIFLAIGAFFLNRSERNNEREIATDRQREAALQSYIDRMADLLLNEKLRTTKYKEVRDVARTRTLSVLRGLDTNRKTLLFQFLVEAKLISIEKPIIELYGADLSGAILSNADLSHANLSNAKLSDADLSRAKLSDANLSVADLSRANLLVTNLSAANLSRATLSGATLSAANLSHADLSFANLSHADLSFANLSHADLSFADLSHADLSYADLSRAILSNADLSYADLSGAILSNADLSHANLSNAKLSDADLSGVDLKQVKSLKNAIMPGGKKHD